ncbi:O-antigen ligase family protein [Corynebacterium wankanglinii]|nr:O-antigen ligase family protein [Corynebacterium wankanglinii]
MVVFVLGTVVTTLQSNGGVREVYYSTQIALLILPPSVALIARKHRESLVTRGEQDHLLFAVAGAIAASGTAVVVQWLLATRFGLSLGHIAFFQNRVSYDLLIPAYSALSALLSIGLPLGPVLWRTGRKLAAVTLPVLSGISIVINSSRTGFVAGAIGLAIILLFPPRGVNRVGNVLLLIPASAFVIWLFNKVTDSSRFKSASLWSANGRFETYTAGYELWTQYPRYFLFGRGYANYPTMPPHNFFLETLVCSGLIVALAVAVVFVRFIWFTWGTSWCYLIATYLTAGMFFSGFYNFKPLAILLIIGICCANPGETWRGGQETSKSTTKNTSPPTISLKHRPQNQMIRQADVN